MTLLTTTSVGFFCDRGLETRHGVLFEERELLAGSLAPTMSHEAADAIIVSLMLEKSRAQAFWKGGEGPRRRDIEAGQIVIADLRHAQTVCPEGRYHALHIRLPKKLLRDVVQGVFTDADGADQPGGGPFTDSILENLGRSVLGDLRRGKPVGGMFLDHLSMALASHVAQTHGHEWGLVQIPRGGMAPWQVRRVQAFLTLDLSQEACLKQAADLCGLSASHFSRTFRQSFGISPHQWRTQRRIEKAQTMLQMRQGTLADIALACGFADQSHFTRCFSREVGRSPGAWRRAASADGTDDAEAGDHAKTGAHASSSHFIPAVGHPSPDPGHQTMDAA